MPILGMVKGHRDGLPVGILTAQGVQFLQSLDLATEWEASDALLRVRTALSVSPGHGSVTGHRQEGASFARRVGAHYGQSEIQSVAHIEDDERLRPCSP